MTILAIDTSNLTLGVALVRDGKVIAEHISHLKKPFGPGDAGDR